MPGLDPGIHAMVQDGRSPQSHILQFQQKSKRDTIG